MHRFVLSLSVVSSLALAFAAGCSSSSPGSGGSSNADVICSGSIGGQTVCDTYSNLPSAVDTSSLCTDQTLKSATSCPTANKSGCCNDIPFGTGTADAYTYGECYYSVPSSAIATLKTECSTQKGTWGD